MSTASIPFILLIISILSIVLLIFYVLSKRPLAQLQKSFLAMLMCVFVISFGVLINTNGPFIFSKPIYSAFKITIPFNTIYK